MPPEPFPAAPELRELIAAIPSDPSAYGPWWDSPTGRVLATHVGGRVARAVVRGVRVRTGRWLEPELVLGLVVEAFAPPSQLVRGLLSSATGDPDAYLSRSLANALAREIGPDRSIDTTEVRWGAATGARAVPISLASAIEAVCRELLPVTPRRLRPTLAEVVDQIVDRAIDGSLSRLHTRTALDERLRRLGWSCDQLRALVNVVIGARPDHARASLVAGFLTREEWRPRESPVHRAAIGAYARRMARSEASIARVSAAA